MLTAHCFGLQESSYSQQNQASNGQTDNDSNSNEPLVSLGTNANAEIGESSGLANSKHVENAIWTHNDSGHPTELYLLHTNGRLLANVTVENSRNRDWEAMASFERNGTRYLMIGDVGDNGKNILRTTSTGLKNRTFQGS